MLKSVQDAGLQPLAYNPPRLVIDDSIRWGPQTSKTVKTSDSKVLVSATTLIEAGPLEGSIEFSLDGKTTFGAVLATEAPVRKEFYHELSIPWSRWVTGNEATLVKRYENGVKKGLWIVLQTYSTPKAHITALNSSKQTTRIIFKVDIGPLGKSTPQGGWSTNYDMGSWVEYSSKVGCMPLSEEDHFLTSFSCEWVGVYSLNWRNMVRFFSSCGSRSNRLSWYTRSVSPKPFCLKRIMLRSDMEVAVFEQVIPIRMEGFPDRSRAYCSSAEHLPYRQRCSLRAIFMQVNNPHAVEISSPFDRRTTWLPSSSSPSSDNSQGSR